MHGKTICIRCKKIMSQCRCIEGHDNIFLDICSDCAIIMNKALDEDDALDRQVE